MPVVKNLGKKHRLKNQQSTVMPLFNDYSHTFKYLLNKHHVVFCVIDTLLRV